MLIHNVINTKIIAHRSFTNNQADMHSPLRTSSQMK